MSTNSQTSNNQNIVGKQLPANLNAERSVLGAILLNDSAWQMLSELVKAEDFYLPQHRTIFKALAAVSEKYKRLDLVTLHDELLKKDELEKVGGMSYLIGLQDELPLPGLVEQHAQIIKEKAVLRDLIDSASGIISKCYLQDEDNLSAVLDMAEKTIFQIAQKRSSNHFVQLDIWLKKTFQHLSSIKSARQGVTGVAVGFQEFDNMTSGLQAGDLVVLAARPSMGKTALALNMALNAAHDKTAIGFFSLEMSAEQLTLRLLSSEAHIPHHAIRNATIGPQEWVQVTNTAAKLAEYKFFIDDTAGLDILELRARARKLKQEHDIKLLVIDYLQLLTSPRKHENRHQEVSDISRSLKALAKELGLPILALSQLSRAVDARVDKRPMLSDLRESGAIEQDADVIMFLYRDVMYNSETEEPSAAELIIGKQRNGPTGTVKLHFVRELTKFEDHP
jgi:replicative DNA helicase